LAGFPGHSIAEKKHAEPRQSAALQNHIKKAPLGNEGRLCRFGLKLDG